MEKEKLMSMKLDELRAVAKELDIKNIMKYKKALGYSTAIKFQMKNGQKCIVNFAMKNHYDLAMKALDGLINV